MSSEGLDRRSLLAAAPLLMAAMAAGDKAAKLDNIKLEPVPEAGPDPSETLVQPYPDITFQPWGNLPPHSGEMAKLYGDFNKPGPYLVLMKWNPGWFSPPHSYATDRVQMVLSGTWWVNSGADFDPKSAIAVPAGGYVKRAARTFHYDGVPSGIKEPVVIAIFGIGPIDIELADPHLPAWRHV